LATAGPSLPLLYWGVGPAFAKAMADKSADTQGSPTYARV